MLSKPCVIYSSAVSLGDVPGFAGLYKTVLKELITGDINGRI